ncbi:hypothetical protein ACINNAV21_1482 [Acinetobacter baumannii Naval-21]|nr:hypothetical protein ACINBC5_A2541 [Acinetobacter baumannii Canada BC-5]EKP50685.1 hypothetical protein ACINNAV21_1482 [Acinetobacter baumannii Naval-21]EKP56124.1 hypothetical protein ACINCANBC1_2415 [Acinetobacter baumannii Canada BC1]KGP65149.1 hypothetical protein A591_A1541 [Acinetobacter baumannii AB5075]KLT88146.1 hypothetical protein T629_2444 [Acinetobacter baumannii MRSN 3405]
MCLAVDVFIFIELLSLSHVEYPSMKWANCQSGLEKVGV